jgi:hypothetical protein
MGSGIIGLVSSRVYVAVGGAMAAVAEGIAYEVVEFVNQEYSG